MAKSEVDYVASGTNDEEIYIGISFAMNDSLTVSVGRQEVDMGAGKVDENQQVLLLHTQWVL